MISNEFLATIIFDIVRVKTLPIVNPVRLRFFDAATDKTLDLFGIPYYTFNSVDWSSPVNKEMQNTSDFVIGTLLESYIGDLTLKFYTNTEEEFLTYTYSANLTAGSVYTILKDSFKVKLPNLSTELAHFLLNYLFKGLVTNKPVNWYLEFQNNSLGVYQTRIVLDADKFSNLYIDEVGWFLLSYGDYELVATASKANLKYAKLYPAATGGSSWLDTSELTYNTVYPGKGVELFNNNLVIAIPPTDLNPTFVLQEDDTVLFYVDFDGTSTDLSNDKQPVVDGVSYNPTVKLFNSNSASVDLLESAEYSDFDFPSEFTLDIFVYFLTNPLDRAIIFLEKLNSFSLYQTVSNNLCISNQDGELLSSSWAPTVGTWYHLYINKTSNNLILKVNSVVDVDVVLSPGTEFASNSNNLVINKADTPIKGLCNGVYIREGSIPFAEMQKPYPKRAYDWKYINSHVWKNMTVYQWFKYCRF